MYITDNQNKNIDFKDQQSTIGWSNPQFETDRHSRAYALSLNGIWNSENLKRFAFNRLDGKPKTHIAACLHLFDVPIVQGEVVLSEMNEVAFNATFESDVLRCVDMMKKIKLHDVLPVIDIPGELPIYRMLLVRNGWNPCRITVNGYEYVRHPSLHGGLINRMIDEFFIPQINARIGRNVASRWNEDYLLISGWDLTVETAANNGVEIDVYADEAKTRQKNFKNWIKQLYLTPNEAVVFAPVYAPNFREKRFGTYLNLHWGNDLVATDVPMNEPTPPADTENSQYSYAPFFRVQWILKKIGEAMKCPVFFEKDLLVEWQKLLLFSDVSLDDTLDVREHVLNTLANLSLNRLNCFKRKIDPKDHFSDITGFDFVKDICLSFGLWMDLRWDGVYLKRLNYDSPEIPFELETDQFVRQLNLSTGEKLILTSGETFSVGTIENITDVSIPVFLLKQTFDGSAAVWYEGKEKDGKGYKFAFDAGLRGASSVRFPAAVVDLTWNDEKVAMASLLFMLFVEQFHRPYLYRKGDTLTVPQKTTIIQWQQWQKVGARIRLQTSHGSTIGMVSNVEMDSKTMLSKLEIIVLRPKS
jgi:hypothetical protein